MYIYNGSEQPSSLKSSAIRRKTGTKRVEEKYAMKLICRGATAPPSQEFFFRIGYEMLHFRMGVGCGNLQLLIW